MSRKLAWILGAFLATVVLISAIGFISVPFILILLGSAAILLFVRYKKKLFIAVFAASICAVLFCAANYRLVEQPILAHIDTTAAVRAEIRSVREGLFFTRLNLRVIEVDGRRLNRFQRFDINLTVYDFLTANIGDIFEAYILFGRLNDADRGFNKSRGIFVTAELAEAVDEENDASLNFEDGEETRIISTERRGFAYRVNNLQLHVQEVFFRNIRASFHDRITQESAVAYGIFTGITDYISPRVRNDFRRAGIFHILSVSGLHLTILSGICATVLRTLGVNKKISSVVVIVFSLLFAGFAGFAVSAVRAAIMITLFYSAFLLQRQSDSVTSLFIAGFLIVLQNPYNALHIGFQLSFAATFGIIFTQKITVKIMEKVRFKALKLIASSVCITLAAVIFTLPITSYNFGSISLVSAFTNIIAGPLTHITLFLALLLSVLSFLNIGVILSFLGWILHHCVGLMISFTAFISSFEYSYISVRSTVNTYFHIFALIFLSACILLVLFFKREKMRRYLYIFAAVSVVLLLSSQIYPRVLFRNTVRFAYFSDYRNQNIIIFHGNYNSADIIDITHGTASPVFETYNILRANGVVNVNSIVLTHYHWRHVRMIYRYAARSDINRVYAPEVLTARDAEVFTSLYHLSHGLGFELVSYQNALRLGDVLVRRGIFEYDRMTHFYIDMSLPRNNGNVNLLYLGIGYESGFLRNAPELFDVDYDIVFYGTHKHNFRADDWVAGIHAGFAGVLSQYLTRQREHHSYRFDWDILSKYIEDGNLFYPSGDFYSHIVFAVDRAGNISQHFVR